AAADVDDVLAQDALGERHRIVGEAEQADVRGMARPVGERRVEAADLLVGIAAGRGQEADPRLAARRELEHEVVERRVPRAGGEAAAAEGEYPPLTRRQARVPPADLPRGASPIRASPGRRAGRLA